ncbi:MAG: tRNA (guanosine(46)-N7)-methyltransferase TrmB [Kiritimatiellae bacterium]|nr:tRNA (guanosine(46)-N7)-methyltransferase TrmB [Kiritimatiellia bacterium]
MDSARIVPDDWLNPLPIAHCFASTNPIEVDLGCGKGRFLIERARTHPDVNFIGIDRMLRRIRKIDNRARRLGLKNIRLLRVEGYYATAYLMPPDAIRAYYIFFPDPWPKTAHHKHRLFNPRFLDALHRTLQLEGLVHAATDHAEYFTEICAVLRADSRFEEIEPFQPTPDERTDFELWYEGKTPIGRISLRKRAP